MGQGESVAFRRPSKAGSGGGWGMAWDGGHVLACHKPGDKIRWMVPQLTEMDNELH